ncbi:succinoglycan biosynthesis protein ExoO [Yoonia maricola]|uniref:Succinoglycan biosynthesis protein ExoO n=1 Tax=Yoonia maricola TaxID=420999 RepID=A0A2M8WKJ0_9RHOB|nr:glycosyltransferase family 2 protein [Yoonia maricola]PJI91452.1 succinoglycan biosynthesis protein ExoO [Yoonia maricola]
MLRLKTEVKVTALDKPTISVIMANYNAAEHIAAALKSVLAQSLSQIEVLLSDDASTDASIAIAHQIAAQDPRLKVIEGDSNAGPATARNRALDLATGDWVAVVDSDDIIHPQRLERMLEAARACGTDAIADDLTYLVDNTVENGSTLLGAACPTTPQEVTAKTFVADTDYAPKMGYLKPIIKRDALHGLRYREDIRIGEDHDFYVRFLLNGGRMHLLPQSYYLYRRNVHSLSHRLHPNDIKAMIRVQDDLLISYSDLPKDIRAAFLARRVALHRPLAFETLVQQIKSRRLGSAITNILHHPALLGQLAGVAKDRLVRRIKPATTQPPKTSTDPSQWTLQDWAELSASRVS